MISMELPQGEPGQVIRFRRRYVATLLLDGYRCDTPNELTYKRSRAWGQYEWHQSTGRPWLRDGLHAWLMQERPGPRNSWWHRLLVWLGLRRRGPVPMRINLS